MALQVPEVVRHLHNNVYIGQNALKNLAASVLLFAAVQLSARINLDTR